MFGSLPSATESVTHYFVLDSLDSVKVILIHFSSRFPQIRITVFKIKGSNKSVLANQSGL